LGTRRAYHSPVRAQAKGDTRTRIVEAMVGVIVEEGVHAFTVQNVADRAGVSHRTVYRYYPSRERLLEGLSESLSHRLTDAGLAPPQEITGWTSYVAPLFEEFASLGPALRASVIAAVALGAQTESDRDLASAIFDSLAIRFSYLSEEQLHEAAGVFRSLVSRFTWYVLSVELRLETAEASRGVAWAIGALLDDLERRNDVAAATVT
jgi:AcrR family transcriptional regulator